MLHDLILGNRSCRRFRGGSSIAPETLENLVNLARLSPSAGNLQPLRFLLSRDPGKNAVIFDHLTWAAYLKGWPGPEEDERPSAYIIILADTEISRNAACDAGIASQSILLGAVEQGLGGCILGSVRRDGLRRALNIPQRYEILLVIALGKPGETIVIEDAGPDGDIKYWRDDKGIHHVPKRRLSDLILKC